MTHEIMTLFGPESVESKECTKCHRVLPITEYSNSSGGGYTRPECKDCCKRLAKERKVYSCIPVPEDYCCPICLRSEEQCKGSGGKAAGAWCIDHDHETGEFRGWLCHACNRTLGNFHDDIQKMKRAIQYLQGEFRVNIEYNSVEDYMGNE